ncbi:MAG: hypothetical protein AB1758_04020 [Candidatus Eremiobacterota bacterium]
MASVRYVLVGESEPRVELAWTGNCEDVSVFLDGTKLGTITNRRELERGRGFDLGEAGQLEVRLLCNALQVTQNGQRLFGTHFEQDRKSARGGGSFSGSPDMAAAAGAMAFVAFMNVALGLLTVMFQIDFLAQIGLGWGTIFFGALFAVLAWFTARGSGIAALLGLAIFALDAVLTVALAMKNGVMPPIGGMILKVYLLCQMARGLSALGSSRVD